MTMFWTRATVLLMIILCISDGMSFQWNCSQPDAESGLRSLPDITDDPDSVIQLNSVNSFYTADEDELIIHSVPSTVDCSGTVVVQVVVAVEFCYLKSSKSGYGGVNLTNLHILTLLTLDRTGSNFNITDIIPVHSTPEEEKCSNTMIAGRTQIYCCDSFPLDAASQFPLPAPNFAFGIIPIRTQRYAALLQFPSIEVNNSYGNLSTDVSIGQVYSLTKPVATGLRLFNFLLGSPTATTTYLVPTSTATEEASGGTTEGERMSTQGSSSLPEGSNPTTTEREHTSWSTQSSTTPEDSNPNVLPTNSSKLPLIIGVTAGSGVGVVVVAILVIAALIAVVFAAKQNRKNNNNNNNNNRRDGSSHDQLAGMETSTNNAYGVHAGGSLAVGLVALGGGSGDKLAGGQYEHIDTLAGSQDYEVILPKQKEDNVYETIENARGAVLLQQEAALLSNENGPSCAVSTNQAYGVALKEKEGCARARGGSLDTVQTHLTVNGAHRAPHTCLEANVAYDVSSACAGDPDKQIYTDISDAIDSQAHPNEAYGVHSAIADDVKVNLAYSISSGGEDKHSYTDISDAINSQARPHTHPNEAYGVHTAIADVKANLAYGVSSASAGEVNGGDYQDKHGYTDISDAIDSQAHGHTHPNEAYGVHTAVKASAEELNGGDYQDKHGYTDISDAIDSQAHGHTHPNEAYGVHIMAMYPNSQASGPRGVGDESKYTVIPLYQTVGPAKT